MLLTLLLGNLLHFVYDWTGQASWAAYISAVNESTWEHMKLLAVPWILWTAVTILIERRADCAAPRAAGLLTGLILIPALFYTYTGICGKSVDVVNVLIFQAAVLAAWLVLARYHAVAQNQFGGITGDLAGWFLQKAELWMLAALAACQWGGLL